jgi:hypothetical protein
MSRRKCPVLLAVAAMLSHGFSISAVLTKPEAAFLIIFQMRKQLLRVSLMSVTSSLKADFLMSLLRGQPFDCR